MGSSGPDARQTTLRSWPHKAAKRWHRSTKTEMIFASDFHLHLTNSYIIPAHTYLIADTDFVCCCSQVLTVSRSNGSNSTGVAAVRFMFSSVDDVFNM